MVIDVRSQGWQDAHLCLQAFGHVRFSFERPYPILLHGLQLPESIGNLSPCVEYHSMSHPTLFFSGRKLIAAFPFKIHVAVTAISNFIIRSLFTVRVFRLSKGNLYLTGWIMAISLADLVVGITITIKAFKIQTFPELSKIADLMYLTFGVGTGSDLSLALALSWLLYGSRTGFRKTDSLIKVLMMYTVNTGMIVAIDASLGLILYIVMPNNFIFLGFYLLLSKLYLNAYLATLNARETLLDNETDMLSIHLSSFSNSNASRRYDVENLHSLPSTVVSNEKTSRPTIGRPTSRGGAAGAGVGGKMAISIQTFMDHKSELELEDSPSRLSYHHHDAPIAKAL
ncbi:hypothetical protein D9613_010511 [Agrocybe pediades]|uniref:DUF6534 domain-containing protein n=1 Tax=Agrocybe pediades TaxID=84607 RepID=A0A8H4QFL4_9AGAR|nr:hypothetical protein D9613_010511 [Agrocybe pediades]